MASDKKAYLRRLVRSQFYYGAAGFGGIYLLYSEFPLAAYFTNPHSTTGGGEEPVRRLLGNGTPAMEVPSLSSSATTTLRHPRPR